VVKVHNLIQNQQLPKHLIQSDVWEKRYRQIRDYERYLIENGYIVLKFFLHISKEEQRIRLLERIDDPSKNWKFEAGDIKERGFWEDYQQAYSEAISNTARPDAPWYVVPSDKKWFARLAISEIIVNKLESLDLHYPAVSDAQKALLEKCRLELM
jgi:polyphosphate kinase 2 (PPK2 family)